MSALRARAHPRILMGLVTDPQGAALDSFDHCAARRGQHGIGGRPGAIGVGRAGAHDARRPQQRKRRARKRRRHGRREPR
ncbi:hypothetical protein BURKHO8Y_120115 [Burkholderia sp. 8Y]|nr:hypothetical protein BURKHO8Y_120115 [Burkholderia sp. 8Y]